MNTPCVPSVGGRGVPLMNDGLEGVFIDLHMKHLKIKNKNIELFYSEIFEFTFVVKKHV